MRTPESLLLNPKTPEEERLADLLIAAECEKIRAENEAALRSGKRVGRLQFREDRDQVEASTFRMPTVYRLSMSGQSSVFLGGN